MTEPPHAPQLEPEPRPEPARPPVDSPGDSASGLRALPAMLFFTLTSNLVLVIATLILGPAAILAAFVPPRGDWSFRIARLWGRLYLLASGVRLDVEGTEPIDPDRGHVFLANHQSMVDVAVLLATVPGQARFLAKASLFRIPVFGWSLRASGYVPVDRRDRAAARDTFHVALRRLREGKSLLIFPEETRSPDGRLLPFKRGGVVLAQRTGFPIVPVGIRGTRHVRPKGRLFTRPHRVRIRYGLPIDPESATSGGDESTPGASQRGAFVESLQRRVEHLAFGD